MKLLYQPAPGKVGTGATTMIIRGDTIEKPSVRADVIILGGGGGVLLFIGFIALLFKFQWSHFLLAPGAALVLLTAFNVWSSSLLSRVPDGKVVIHRKRGNTIFYLPGDWYPDWRGAEGEEHLSLAEHADTIGAHVVTWKPDLRNIETFLASEPIAKLRELFAVYPRLDFAVYGAYYGIEVLAVNPPQPGTRTIHQNDIERIFETFPDLVKRFAAIGGGAAAFEEAFERDVLGKYSAVLERNPELRARLIALKDDVLLRLIEKMTR